MPETSRLMMNIIHLTLAVSHENKTWIISRLRHVYSTNDISLHKGSIFKLKWAAKKQDVINKTLILVIRNIILDCNN